MGMAMVIRLSTSCESQSDADAAIHLRNVWLTFPALIERAQFAHNQKIYEKGGVKELAQNAGYDGSWLEWFLKETESMHGQCAATVVTVHVGSSYALRWRQQLVLTTSLLPSNANPTGSQSTALREVREAPACLRQPHTSSGRVASIAVF